MASASLRAALTTRSLLYRSPRLSIGANYLRTMSTSTTPPDAAAAAAAAAPPPPPPPPATIQHKVKLIMDRPGDPDPTFQKTELSTAIDLAKAKFIDVVDAKSAIQTGAVLPFAKWNFLQVLVFPYTYSLMYYMDFLLNYLPWWQAILVTTATARLVFFPLVVRQNVIGIKTFNLLPETQKLQVKLNDAMVNGDAYNQALNRTKIKLLYQEHGLSMKDRLIPILIQAPMYASIFFLLRGLTSVPAEGLATGGAFWFTDLTVPDPLFILPMMTSATMFLLFEFGMEGSVDPKKAMGPAGRYTLRSIPLLMFFFFQGFPAATLLFWSASNSFTLFFALVLKNAWVKKQLKIPKRLNHDPASLPMSQITFSDQLKQAMEKGAVKRTSIDVRRLDDIAFRKAGVGPLRKTYKEPPKGA